MTAAWLGQLQDAAAACVVAVHLHGVAGDLAAASHSEIAMTATDLVDALGDAVQQVQEATDSESERSGDSTDRP